MNICVKEYRFPYIFSLSSFSVQWHALSKTHWLWRLAGSKAAYGDKSAFKFHQSKSRTAHIASLAQFVYWFLSRSPTGVIGRLLYPVAPSVLFKTFIIALY